MLQWDNITIMKKYVVLSAHIAYSAQIQTGCIVLDNRDILCDLDLKRSVLCLFTSKQNTSNYNNSKSYLKARMQLVHCANSRVEVAYTDFAINKQSK